MVGGKYESQAFITSHAAGTKDFFASMGAIPNYD